jgi:hypothetical protein
MLRSAIFCVTPILPITRKYFLCNLKAIISFSVLVPGIMYCVYNGKLFLSPVYCHYFMYVSRNRQVVLFLQLPFVNGCLPGDFQ